MSDEKYEVLARRLQHLEDHLEITRLLASYGPLVDRGDADGAAGLWTENGEYDVPGLHMRSREDIRAMVYSESHQNFLRSGSTHFIGPAHVSIDGDRATAVCESILVTREAESYRILLSGSHRIRLARTPDGWRVEHRITRELNGAPEARELLRIDGPAA
ncbi:nuclear transport factor 2 family protein [Dietzia sp. CH92]|uniref:nuclear transport factor 2 family protein n=1 Tax=Dietzia sp. CH92 TaxID=3051823 RepID=UPI0028D7700D|nr:nuclear transport factor 2 family protein [Dietzia sp. CH92]